MIRVISNYKPTVSGAATVFEDCTVYSATTRTRTSTYIVPLGEDRRLFEELTRRQDNVPDFVRYQGPYTNEWGSQWYRATWWEVDVD